MSLIISLYVPEGIVLAGDSRLTLNWSEKNPTGETIHFSINGSDTNSKIFAIQNKFGLGAFGMADIKGVPIAGFINEFIEEKIEDKTEVNEIPEKLQEFFGKKFDYPAVNFYVAGYKIEKGISIQHVYFVNIAGKTCNRVNDKDGAIHFGANWGGEIEILQRLIQDVQLRKGADWSEMKASPIMYNFLTLQDAIDFCEFGIRTTIETLRFQRRAKTVGGSIDTLIIRPKTGAEWIRKKGLS
jgi:hypothetical protein